MHPLDPFRYCPRCGSPHFNTATERSKRCADCGFDYYSNAAAAVAAVITDTQGRTLLTTRAFEPARGTLDLPGGFVENGETAEEALRREVREELGIELNTLAYLTSQPNIYPFAGIEIHTLDMIFRASITPGDTISPSDDVAQAQFYELSPVVLNRVGLPSIRKVLSDIYDKKRQMP